MRDYIQENLWFVSVMTILVIGFGFFLVTNSGSKDTLSRSEVKDIQGLKEFNKPERQHKQGTIQYAESPPAGGNHAPIWVACDAKSYDQEVVKEMAVHSLEHGAVWITHTSTLEKAKVDQLKTKVKTSGNTFLTPYSDQKAPIMLTAWGKQLEISDVNDPRIDQFMVKFRKGPQTPEPGATCSSPQGA